MADVARALGISAMTVSRALANSPKVTRETQKRVAEAVRRLGYRPHPYLRSWMSSRRKSRVLPEQVSIGFLNFWNPSSQLETRLHCREILSGCRQKAEELGYHLDVIAPRAAGISMERLHQILQSRGIRGLLIPPLPESCGRLRLPWEKYAAVAIGYTLRSPDLNRVAVNPALAMDILVRQLKRSGYRRIGLVATRQVTARINNYHTAVFLLYQAGIQAADRIPLLRLEKAPAAQLKSWIRRYRPDVIIAETEGIYTLLRQTWSIPDQFGVALFSWYREDCERLKVKLAGIDLGNRRMGAKAVELIAGQIEGLEYGIPGSASTLLVSPEWHFGETVRKAESRIKKNSVPAP